MPLTHSQRLDRLNERLAELAFWRERETVPVTGWRFDDEEIGIGAPWPRSDGVVRFEAEGEAPDRWPLDETRLILDLGGDFYPFQQI